MAPAAPPLTGTHWLNDAIASDDRALSRDELRGRPTVLLFWATTCEGSWVRLRQLERLAERHGDDLAVVAVHSPRFAFEQEISTLRAAVTSRGVSVPVVHDPSLATWARYGPTGRPTVVVLDHRARVVGAIEGVDPGSITALDEIVDEMVALSGAAGRRRRERQRAPHDEVADDVTPLHRLLGPASAARQADGTIVVADRGTGRLLTITIAASGSEAEVISAFGGVDGIGAIAVRSDGALTASFPDRGTVERIDLAAKERVTIAADLVRPMGLTDDVDGSVVVADAGADELVRIGAETGPIAGGRRLPVSQPLSLVRIDAGLLFCEASTGALRLLSDSGSLHTLQDGSRPGLVDGPVHRASFQRPTGLAALGSAIAIADLGNDRVRLLLDRRVTTLPIVGLCRPEAVVFLDHDRLLVCDTGNHRLVVVDMAAHTADELIVDGLPL